MRVVQRLSALYDIYVCIEVEHVFLVASYESKVKYDMVDRWYYTELEYFAYWSSNKYV